MLALQTKVFSSFWIETRFLKIDKQVKKGQLYIKGASTHRQEKNYVAEHK